LATLDRPVPARVGPERVHPARVYAVQRRATVALWSAILLWTGAALFVRAGHADPLVFTTWRLWFALPVLGLVVSVRRRRGEQIMLRAAGVSRRQSTLLVVGAGAFFAAGAASAFVAIEKTRLLDVTLISALQPVIIIVVAVLFLGERVAARHVGYAGVAIAGTAIVAVASSGRGAWSLSGELIAVASLLLNAGWYLYGRVLRDRYAVDPFAFMLGVLSAAAVLMTPVALIVSGSLSLTRDAYLWAAGTMCVGTAAHLLLVWAHRYVPASVSAPLLLAEAPLVAVAAWIWFGESLGLIEIAGSAVVIAALWGMARSPAVTHVEDEIPDPAPAA
jgi:drug/metabolite transporter (DMT)-like permease